MSKAVSSRHCLLDNKKKWDEAIVDVESKLLEAKNRVTELSEAMRIFKRRRKSGEPFFGRDKQ